MTSYKPRAVMSVALASLLGAGAAHADITADQVWADWQAYIAANGDTLTGAEARNGDTLTVTDIIMLTDFPEDDVSMQVTMSEVTFTDVGDGTVSVGFPAAMPMAVMIDAEGEDPVIVKATFATTDWSGIISGDPDAMSYVYSAAEMAFKVDEFTVDQVTFPMSLIGAAEMSFADFAGSTQSRPGALYETVQTATTGAVSYLVDITDPEAQDGKVLVKGGADGMEMDMTIALPENSDWTDMARMLARGLVIDSQLKVTGGRLDFDFTDAGESAKVQSSSESNDLAFKVTADGAAYSLATAVQKIFMTGSEIPLPIEASVEESLFSLQMPVTARDEVQPMAMTITLGDVAVSDLIWGLIDPSGQLPRDPATVSLALAGTAKLLVDFLDPVAMAQLESAPIQPGELHSLDVKGLTVRAAGAELLGDGAFTFDNSDLTTFDGFPAPTGNLNLSLSGGNGLLDKLVAMGLIPDQEASGVRMMMGLFAVPGSAPDTLTSTIEVQGNGQIFANGQRIQ